MQIRQEEIIEQDIISIRRQLADLESKIKGKVFVVSGGAGFLGSWFCEVAVSFGARVICVDNLIASSEENILKLEALLTSPLLEVLLS